MSVNTEIRAALETQLATVSGLPASAERAKENGSILEDEFEPPLDEAWLSHRLAFGPEQLLTKPAASGRTRRDGVWRLLVRFPLGTGTAAADDLVQAIVDAFPEGQSLTSGSTTVQCDSARRWGGGRDIDEEFYTVPIDLRWHVHGISALV